MELRINQDVLVEACAKAAAVTPRKTTMPILLNVLVDATSDGAVSFTSTDLDIATRIEGRADVSNPGKICVNAAKLRDIARNMPGPDVSLTTLDNHYVAVKSSRATFRIGGMDHDEYPQVGSLDADKTCDVGTAVLISAIDKTDPSISTDESRNVICGLYIEPKKGGEVVFVSTDGHRLAFCSRTIPGALKAIPKPIIVPRKGIIELRRMAEFAGESLSLGLVKDSHLVASCDDATLSMRLIDGRFPDYNKVIPSGAKRSVALEARGILDMLKRTSLIGNGDRRAVRMELLPGVLRLTSQNPDLGDATEELPVDFAGDPLCIGFNPRYLSEAISATGSANVVLEFTDELAPALVRSDSDSADRCVVMPMRV